VSESLPKGGLNPPNDALKIEVDDASEEHVFQQPKEEKYA
jgi:hypothetical protein